MKAECQGSFHLDGSDEWQVTFTEPAQRAEALRELRLLVRKPFGTEAAHGGYESLGPYGMIGRGRFGGAQICKACLESPGHHAHKVWVLWVARNL